jgi:hypothetical protein
LPYVDITIQDREKMYVRSYDFFFLWECQFRSEFRFSFRFSSSFVLLIHLVGLLNTDCG